MIKKILPSIFLLATTIHSFGQCTGTDLLGSASNMFTIGITESNSIAVDNNINSLIFVHRNNATAFGGSSGHLRYDISTNGGFSWSNNQGPVNPLLTFAARYPNVSIYNPVGNSNPNNAYLVYYAPTVNGAVFDNHVAGVRKLDGTGNTETYDPAAVTQKYIPRSLCKGAPGIFWTIEQIYNGTATTGFRALKGTWNGSNNVTWAQNVVFNTPFNTGFSGVAQHSDYAIAFDPTGQIGWACILSHMTPGPAAYSFYPVFYKTTDGGNNWSGPDQVDIGQFSCVSSIVTAGNVPIVAFDVDLTVDINGNPHAAMCIGNGNNAYAIYFTSPHHMYDITLEHGLWNAIDMGNVNAGRNTFGTAPNQLSMDMEPQATRTDDGTKVFFTWTGSDAAPVALAPNLFGNGYDVQTKTWTPMYALSSCNPATDGRILFPKMSENVLNVAGGWELPVIYGECTIGTDVASISNFRYLDSLLFTNSNFTLPQCTTALSFVQGDTAVICEGSGDSIFLAGVYDAIRWNDGNMGMGIPANAPGWYYAAARAGCCIGFDSIFVVIDSLSVGGFTHDNGSLNVNFTDLSAGQPSGWFWDFGDATTSTAQHPSHTFATIGTYTVCLIVSDNCGADTICQLVTVTCPNPVSSFNMSSSDLLVNFTNTSGGGAANWDFGDGGTSTQFSPAHQYAAAGSYIVCLTTVDSCGTHQICDTINITCPIPSPNFSYNIGMGGMVMFTNLTSPAADNYSWDFGDGGTSTQFSPMHTYATSNNYNVCLMITDSCGTDTFCTSITVVVDASVENLLDAHIKVYPNPTNGQFIIQGELANDAWVSIALTDLLGKVVEERIPMKMNGAISIPMSLESYPSGIYLLTVNIDGALKTYKVIKK